MKLSRFDLLMSSLPVVGGGVASILFLAQGGFGGGHGNYDGLIIVLCLPSVLMSEAIAPLLPKFIRSHDFFLIIVFPTLINILLFRLAARALVKRLR
jgi:hypothetical protein